MSRIRKARVVRVLLFVHLFLFFWAAVFWGGGYVSLAHHRHEGVVYELIELFAPDSDYWRHPHSTMVPREVRSVSIGGAGHDGDWAVRIIWRGTLEQNLEWISQVHDSPALFTNLSWVEGVGRSGNPEPTLIAWGTGKVVYSWFESAPWDRPEQVRYGRDPFDVSLRIYNVNRFWLVWSKLTRIPPPNVHVHGQGWGLPDWALWGASGARTAADIFGRLYLYRRGGVSPGFLLAVLGMPPRDIRHFVNPLAEREIFWLLPRPQAGWGGRDIIYVFALVALAVPTVPYRYLFYLPLALVPRVLAWPFAVLYALFLLGSWVWCAARWRRLGRRAPSS